MNDPHLIDRLGAEDVRRVLGLSRSSIKEARRNPDGMPPSWFVALDKLGAEKGIPVPRSAFKWRAADGVMIDCSAEDYGDGSPAPQVGNPTPVNDCNAEGSE